MKLAKHVMKKLTVVFENSKKICLDYSSFIQNISVFTKDFKNHKAYFKPLISGKINFCAWFVGSLLFVIFSSGKMSTS